MKADDDVGDDDVDEPVKASSFVAEDKSQPKGLGKARMDQVDGMGQVAGGGGRVVGKLDLSAFGWGEKKPTQATAR